MRWSLKIARPAGIDVFVHWTFLILIAWVIFSQMSQGQTFWESLWGVWFVLAIFACVVLHELGHALTARRYDVKTKNIVLLPIGGVANLEKMPEEPVHELWVALAGPAVNVVIALLLFVLLSLTGSLPDPDQELAENMKITTSNFLPGLLGVNILLVLFNLIPAFPMDGGRVLRALLAMRFGRTRATEIASQLGQFLAIAFVLVGLFAGNFWLPFIGIFIYLGASAEANYEATRSVLSQYQVKDVLMKQYSTLHAWERLDRAVEMLLNGQEKEFLVTEEGEQIIGVITRDDIIRGLRDNDKETPIKRITNRDFVRLQLNMDLQDAYTQLSQSGTSIAPVYDGDELAGILDNENIMELIMLQNAMGSKVKAGV